MAFQTTVAVAASDSAAPAVGEVERASPYAYYALLLLLFANFFNYVDRTLPSIVSLRMKADMHLTDAQLGFLLGTAFAVFYGVIGLGMGRVADAVSRPRLMALGLSIWSGMTTLTGFSPGFPALAAARLGVGVGEAAATPCSYSLLCEVFPPRNRAIVLGAYLLGTHLGVAAALIGGGLLLQHWTSLCHAFPAGACRVADWRAAFMVVGLPGLLLSVVIAFLRDPGAQRLKARRRSAGRVALQEFSAAVPPLTLLRLQQVGGPRAVGRNLLLVVGLAAIAAGLSLWLGDVLQWTAMAIGAYAVTTWASVLRRTDAPLFRMTMGCPTFLLFIAGSATCTFIVSAVQVWSAPYAMRTFHAGPAAVGVALGLTGAATGALSVVVGGLLCDAWKKRDARAPAFITAGSLLASIPAFAMMMRAESLPAFVTAYVAYVFLGMAWSGPTAALAQDLVLPRMRGTSAAAFSLINILVGTGVGPYWAGKVSSLSGSLQTGLSSLFLFAPVSMVLLLLAARGLTPRPHAERQARANALEADRLASGMG